VPKREELIHLLLENTTKTASQKLSAFLSQKIILEESSSKIINLAHFPENLGSEEQIYTVLAMKLTAGINGTFLLLLDSKSVELLKENLLSNYHISQNQNEQLKDEAIKEMGNIFLGALLTEIAKATKIKANYSTPGMVTDMLKASLDEITADLLLENQSGYLFESDLALNPLGISIKLMFVFDTKSLDLILKESAS
jgi:chemotaxis protein CheY-P-specific phosphatase CheC